MRELAETTLNFQSIYAPHGSFLILSQTFFEHGGVLDDSEFLYAEEISLAETCRQIKLTVSYDPELTVIHDEHRTTGRKYNRTTYFHQKNALNYLTSSFFPDVL